MRSARWRGEVNGSGGGKGLCTVMSYPKPDQPGRNVHLSSPALASMPPGYHKIFGAVKERSGTPGSRVVSDTGVRASARKRGDQEASLFILGFCDIHERRHGLSGLTASGISSQKRG